MAASREAASSEATATLHPIGAITLAGHAAFDARQPLDARFSASQPGRRREAASDARNLLVGALVRMTRITLGRCACDAVL